MNITVYHSLPKEAIKIREHVFMKEQGFQQEFDETDSHATHLVLFLDHIPVATCRFYKSAEENEYIIGRIAVLKQYRGLQLGSCLLAKAEEEIKKAGGTLVRLHAQQQAVPFYNKQGYSVFGDIDLDENCPHVWMSKQLFTPS